MMLFMDGFDHYGAGSSQAVSDNLLSGVYADIGTGTTIGVPTFGARTGPYAIHSNFGGIRKVLDATTTNLIVGHGFAVDTLPTVQDKQLIFEWRSGANANFWDIRLQTTGVIEFWSYLPVDGGSSSNPVMLFATQAPVIVAGNWHYLEYKIDTAAGTFRLDVDGITVINVTGTTFASQAIAQFNFGFVSSSAVGAIRMWFDDLTIRDTSGARNNGFEGDLRVAALFANNDGPNQGWTPQYLHNIGTGVLDDSFLDTDANNTGVYCATNSGFAIGSSDFTLEGFFRFNALPTGTDIAALFSRWSDTNNNRSYQLYKGGDSIDSGNLVFRTSTNGQAGTVVNKISWPWTPDPYTWYNVVLERIGGELLLFIDGVQQGQPVTDGDTYFAAAAPFSTGIQVNGTTSSLTNSSFNGWVDEVRFTNGVGRYSGDFTPTTVPFPRTLGGDPDFNSVVLLMGFDSGINDESSFGRAVTPAGSAAAITPTDGEHAYQTINKPTPFDSTFIEAALLPASNLFTLDAQPAAADTTTVGTYTDGGTQTATYKFVAALVDPFDVLIGAALEDTLDNLVAAINHDAGEGTLYGTGTLVNDDVFAAPLPGDLIRVQANVPGAAGNSIASTSSLTNGGGWDSATLTGGQDIPGPSDFYFQRPPVNTTIIKAVQIMTRAFKNDSGPASLQTSFVGPLGAEDLGADDPLTISPSYRWDIFETDPDTSGDITPSTIVGGRVRVNRTE